MNTSSNFQALLEPKFRKIFFDTYDEKPEQFSKVFNVRKSKKAKEHDHHVAGTGLWDIKQPGGTINEEDMALGEEVTYVHTAYAKMIQVEREFADDELYGVVEKLPKTLARGGRATVEGVAASILNNAFTVNGYDGKPLVSDSHPLIKGGTNSNLMTGAPLAGPALALGITQYRSDLKTEEGLKLQANPDKLVVSPDNEFNAAVLLSSAYKPGTDHNDINVLKGKLSAVVLDYLTSATAWFLIDNSLNELNFFWRVRPEFKGAENFDNMVAKYRGYLRFSCGYSDWRGILGNTGVVSSG